MVDLILNVLVIIMILSLPGFVLYFKNSVYEMYSIEDFENSFDRTKLNKFGAYTFKSFMTVTKYVNLAFWKIVDLLNYIVRLTFFKR